MLVIVLHYPLQLDWEAKVYFGHGSFSLVHFQGMSLSCILHCYLCCGLLSPFWVCGSTYEKSLQLCNLNCCTLQRLWFLLLCGKDLALLIQIWCRRLWPLHMYFQFSVRTCKAINSIQTGCAHLGSICENTNNAALICIGVNTHLRLTKTWSTQRQCDTYLTDDCFLRIYVSSMVKNDDQYQPPWKAQHSLFK
jgi:hypothetical protein